MKKIGFLSFGHWSASPYSHVRSGADALIQSIELAEAVEELGADGAYFRVHHFARQLGSPFPLLAAVGARTRKIEIGTAVDDLGVKITRARNHQNEVRGVHFAALNPNQERLRQELAVVGIKYHYRPSA